MKSEKLINIILLSCLVLMSCRSHHTTENSSLKPGKDEMADLNRYLVQKDRERIQNYIERKNLHMKESPTGLWYQVMNEGTGRTFAEGDRVVFDYECSLLDGTECYSSSKQGPMEVVLGKSELEQGLLEGLKMLKPGASAIFIIPPFLGYGLLGDSKKIPPRAVIVYNVSNLRSK